MALRSMGFACPTIGSAVRHPTPAPSGDESSTSCPNSPAASRRTPSRSRRSLAYLRDRGAASIGALRSWGASIACGNGEMGRSTPPPRSSGRLEATSPGARSRRSTSSSNLMSATSSGNSTRTSRSSQGSTNAVSSANSSASTNASRRNIEGASTPPTSPPTTPPHPAGFRHAQSQGISSRPVPSYRPRASAGGLAPACSHPIRIGPANDDGYHDLVLPCGLLQDQVIDLMYRDLNPEDFEALSKLDERLPKRNTARPNLVDRLPRTTAGECGVTECRVCLAELQPNVSVALLPCKHAFHTGCISKWLTQCKNTCPLCQAPIEPQLQNNAQSSTRSSV